MTTELKKMAAQAALPFITNYCLLGVGTGSTVNQLIELLPSVRERIDRVVASSVDTARRLEIAGLRCSTLESVGRVDVYVDGADEIDDNHQMIKGGGGAHTREKILACCADRFVVIVDASKVVKRLGRSHPLPVEVIPMARSYVARQLVGLGGNVRWREGIVTDNGNWLLDVTELDLTDSAQQERQINQIVGVVDNGLFAVRRADTVIIANKDSVRIDGKTTIP